MLVLPVPSCTPLAHPITYAIVPVPFHRLLNNTPNTAHPAIQLFKVVLTRPDPCTGYPLPPSPAG